MAKHIWVELKYTPVTAILESNNTISVYTTEESHDVANAEAKLGCWFCYTPLDEETINGECPGPSSEESNTTAGDTSLGQ